MFKYSVILFYCLDIFRKFSSPCLFDGQFIRHISLENTHPVGGQEFYSKSIKNRSRAECAMQCLQLRSSCVGLVYSETRSVCYLLKSGFNEKVLDVQAKSSSWEYWFKYYGTVCPGGWLPFDGHCYLFNKTASSWNDAKGNCEKKDAFLVEVNTVKENNFLQKTFLDIDYSRHCYNDYVCPVWMGGNDIDTEYVFIWSGSKEHVMFSNWHPDEPNNLENQDCISLLHTGQWDDAPCYSKMPFICEKVL